MEERWTYRDRNFLIGRVTRLDDTGSHNKWRKRGARPKNQYEKEKETRLLYSTFKWEYINSPKFRVRWNMAPQAEIRTQGLIPGKHTVIRARKYKTTGRNGRKFE